MGILSFVVLGFAQDGLPSDTMMMAAHYDETVNDLELVIASDFLCAQTGETDKTYGAGFATVWLQASLTISFSPPPCSGSDGTLKPDPTCDSTPLCDYLWPHPCVVCRR